MNLVPSRAEVWSLLLGALLASAVLASAFQLTVTARAPIVEEDTPRAEGAVVVRPEPPRPALRPVPRTLPVGEVASR